MNKKLKFLFYCSIEYFQAELPLNSEQKAEKMHVSPAIANAM
jgi:hypothetical protein